MLNKVSRLASKLQRLLADHGEPDNTLVVISSGCPKRALRTDRLLYIGKD